MTQTLNNESCQVAWEDYFYFPTAVVKS